VRIAILAPTAQSAFQAESPALIGGAERQLALLARALVERGHRVDVLVAGDEAEPIEGAYGRLWPRYPLGGLPLLKLIHPKGSAILRFLGERDSELLLQRGASELTALGAAAARLKGIPFVFVLASDRDLDPGREILPHPQDRVLFHESLRAAGCVIAQTRAQVTTLWRRYGRMGKIVPSFLDAGSPDPAGELGAAVIWGGNIRPIKRPEWLIVLAQRFPDQRFIVYGGPGAGCERYAERIFARMRALPNIDILGRLAPALAAQTFRRARILVNSSEAEGFPNTFLEAWRQGLRVLASVDPDHLLQEEGLGIFAPNLEAMSKGLSALSTESETTRRAAQERARAYVAKHHEFNRLADTWEALLVEASSPLADIAARREAAG